MVQRVQAAGVPVCVASQGKLAKTRLTLGLAGLDRLIPSDAVFSAYSVPRGKPHPDLFLYAAEQMGADPAGCVVVEDTPLGVTAATLPSERAGPPGFGPPGAYSRRAPAVRPLMKYRCPKM